MGERLELWSFGAVKAVRVSLYETEGGDGSSRQHLSDHETIQELKMNRRSFRDIQGSFQNVLPPDASQEAAQRSVIGHGITAVSRAT